MVSVGWRGKVWRSCAAVWARLSPDLVAPGDRVTPKVVRTALDDVLRELGAGPPADGASARSEPVAEWVAAAVADLRPDHNGFVGYEDLVDIAEQYCDFAALAGRPLAAAELPPPRELAEAGAPQDEGLRAKVERLCHHAFRWVDPEGMDVLNPSQAKTALVVVFGRLRAPPPPDEWHEQVFENFDDDEDGLIDAEDLVDIAAQYCEAHPPEGDAAAAGGAGSALPVAEPAGSRTAPDHSRPNNGLAGMGFGSTHPSAAPAYPSAGLAYPNAAGSAFGNTGTPYHGAGTTYGIAGSGLGNAGPGFGNAAPGFGNAGPGFGNAGQGFGNAGPGFNNAGPGFGNQRPGFGNTGPGFGNGGPGLGGAQMAYGSVGPLYTNPGPAHGSGGSDFGLGRPDNYGSRPGYGSAGPAYGTGAVYGSGTWASHGNTGTSHSNWSEFGPGNAPYGNMAMPQDARVAAWQSRHGPLSMPGLPPPQSRSVWGSAAAPHELGMPPLPSPGSGGFGARQQDSAMPPLPPPNSGGMPSMPPGPPTMPSQSSASRPQEPTAPVIEGQPPSAPGSAARARCESTGMPSLPGLSSQSTATQPTLSSNSRPASKWDDLHSSDGARAAASKLSQAELDNKVRPSEQVTSAPATSAEATTPIQPQPDAASLGANHKGSPSPDDLDLRPSASQELAADTNQRDTSAAAPAAGQPPAPQQPAADAGRRASAGTVAPASDLAEGGAGAGSAEERAAAAGGAQAPPRRAEGGPDHAHSVGTASTRTSRADSASGFVVPKKSRGRKSTHFAEKLEEVVPVVVEGELGPHSLARRRSSRKGSVPIAQQVMTPSHRQQLSVFDDYDFVEERGGGAFGRVMQVQHREAGFRRACKCVAIRSKKHMAAVDTEVALMRRLDHPNILRIFESYYDGDRSVYLVIELCSGGSLADRLKHYYPKPLPEEQAAGIARGLFSAVQYCHRRGIVHRDLKPENVLFTHCGADASLKVIDFGLSDFRARLARMECQAFGARARPVCIGTPHYMAPEIYNENIYDEKVDTFACGVMLAEALTAVHPFFELGKDNLQTIRKNIIDAKVDWSGRHWAKADPKSKDLVGKLLEPARAQRLTALEALRHPWVAAALKRDTGEAVSTEVFECIERFCSWHVLGQAACRVLARQLDEAALAAPRADFRLLDLNGDGVISAWELMQGSRSCGAHLGQQDVAELMQAFDRTGQFSAKPLGDSVEYEIAWTEFLAAVLSRGEEASTEQAMYVFKRFAGDFEAITPESLQGSLTVNFGNVSMHDASLADYIPPSNDGEVVSKEELDRVFTETGGFSHLQGLAAAERLVEFRQFRAMLRPEALGRRRSSA